MSKLKIPSSNQGTCSSFYNILEILLNFDPLDRFQPWKKVPSFILLDSGLTSLSAIFQSYREGVWTLQGAQCLLFRVLPH